MTPLRPRAALATHEVLNQPEPRAALPLWDGDAPLRALIAARAPDAAAPLQRFAAAIGSPEAQDDARMAERNPPELRLFDRAGRRIDEVDFHPGWHATLARGPKRAMPPAPGAADRTGRPKARSPMPPWSI